MPRGPCTAPTRSCARCSPSVEDPYLRERDSDVADVAGRVRMNLRRSGDGPSDRPTRCATSTARRCSSPTSSPPRWRRSSTGRACSASPPTPAGRTHHTAILARSLKVPAVVGLRDASRRVRPGTPVVIDGTAGEVDLDAVARRRRPRRSGSPSAAGSRRTAPRGRPVGPAVTADGVAIRLDANLERLDDVAGAARRRRRRHRPVPLRVPARRPRRRQPLRGPAGRDLPRPAGGAWRRGRSRSAPSTSTSGSRPRGARAIGATRARACAACASAWPGRRCCARSCGRCCARRRPARCASCSRS